MKILIAAWGCPWSIYDENLTEDKLRWIPVTYIIRINNSKHEMKTIDTIPLLDEVFNFDKIIIIVQDTVLVKKVSNYDEVCKNVHDMYMNFIKSWNIADVHKVDLIVCPGVGNFVNKVSNRSVRLSIDGEMYDFYAVLYLELSRRLCNIHDYDVDVHVDLTHGINYMPTLLYRAVKEILQIIAYTKNVKLHVYNSEPFAGRDTPLNIHIVEESELKPDIQPEVFKIEKGRARIKPLKALDKSIGRELSYKLNTILEEINDESISLFISSIVNGLPMLLYNTIPEPSKIDNALTRIYSIYREYTVVEGDENSIKIVHRASFRKDIEVLSRILVLSKSLKDMGICRLDEVTMKDIEKLETSIFSKREKYMHLISCDRFEIENRIRETLKGEILREYTPLAKIFNTQCDEKYFKSISSLRS